MNAFQAKSRVWAVVLLSCVAPALIGLAAHFLFGNARYVEESLRVCVELSGSSMALVVAMLIWLRVERGPPAAYLTWVAAALAGMGLLDTAQNLAPYGVAWSWLRQGATLLGGSLFALVWLPPPFYTVHRGRWLILTVAVLAIAGSLGVWYCAAVLPTPFVPGGYSIASEMVSALGGLGFLAAALFFVWRYLRQPAAEDLAFASQTFLFGTSGLLFGFSHLWAADWWIWHAFHLLAYGIALIAAYEMVVTLYRKIALHAQELEDGVQAHMAELQRLAAIVESSDDAIVSKSLDGVIITWNSGAERLYGYTAAEAVGRPLTLVVPPDLYGEVQLLLRRVLRGESVLHHETVRVRKDGGLVDVSVSLSAVRDAYGGISGASAIARDITERKRAEAAQQESEAALLALADAVPQIVWTCTPDGLNVYSNQRWVEYTGLTLAASYGTGWNAPFHPDDRQAARDAWNRATQTGEMYSVESRLRSAEGGYHWFLMRGVPMCDAAGRIVKWFGTCTDIEYVKRAEETLRKLNDELRQASAYNRSLIEASLDPLVIIAPDGRITDVNRATEAATGLTRQALIGTDFSNYFRDPERARAGNRKVFEEGWTQDELELRHRDASTRPVLYNASVYRNEAGETVGIFAAARDITERKRVEVELRELNANLEHRVAERTADLVAVNQELEAFNYTVSHDLRAPLRHIDGYSKILLEDHGAGLSDDGRRCVERIRGGARRMGRMVDELLELSRTSRCELSKELTGLKLLVTEVVEELQPEVAGREVEWRMGELPFADCDPTLARQVFANLVANAIKFTRDRKPAVIEVGTTLDGGQTVLFVRDNGVGFSMNHAGKLFGVFQRLHSREDFEGTGVGLATVERIVQRHGGRVWAEAEPDKGATFYFTLERPGRQRPAPSSVEPIPVLVGER